MLKRRKLLADEGLLCFEDEGETDSITWKILKHRALFEKKGIHFSISKTNVGKISQNELVAEQELEICLETSLLGLMLVDFIILTPVLGKQPNYKILLRMRLLFEEVN